MKQMQQATVLKYINIARKELNHSKDGAFYESDKIERGLTAARDYIIGGD